LGEEEGSVSDFGEDGIGRKELLKILPKRSRGVEIGVWKADFSKVLLEQLEPVELHLIDPWECSDETRHASTVYRPGQEEELEKAYQKTLEVVRPWTNSGVVRVHRGKSENILPGFPESHFDWVYVDGDHSFIGVSNDLWLAERCVKPGGLLAGDDYFNKGWWGMVCVERLLFFRRRD